MPTTTKGTWTPADNDDWDLTIDLAAMANSIDLWTTGRYEKSGASVAALGTGDYVGQLGYVTSPAPGRAMRWNGSVWVNTPGSGAFSGTAAQRGAYLSTASEGDMWRDTDGTKGLYVKQSGAWAPAGVHNVVPYTGTAGTMVNPPGISVLTGVVSGTTNSGGVLISSFPVAFPTACIGVVLLENNIQNGAIVVQSGFSRTGFITFWAGKGTTAVSMPYIAFGY